MFDEIPARGYSYYILHPGQAIKIINPSGHQVVDTWAFPAEGNPASWMSMSQSRQKLGRLRVTVGDTLVDTIRRPILTLMEDTSSGIHDMLYPACDAQRYAELGHEGHASCAGNLREALHDVGDSMLEDFPDTHIGKVARQIFTSGWTPEPLNLFMNVAVESATYVSEEGRLQVKRPDCKKNTYVVLRAETECFIVMSACPNDILDTNGGKPGPAAFEFIDG